MSYREKPAGPGRLDDTVPLTARIEASQNLHSHTEYIIKVQRGVASDNTWQVIRRYSDFDALNSSLMVSGLSLPLPPKKLIGNMDREFIAERQRGLQSYLDYITQHALLRCSLHVKKFLDPNNYSANYTELALQQVSMFFRSDHQWEVLEPLRDMGWRIRKQYFLIKNKEQPRERYLLSWVDLGPDQALSDKDLQSVLKLLTNTSSPALLPLVFSSCSESSALLVRPFSEHGSLRDLIWRVKPRESYLKKYCNPKKSQGLEMRLIREYGRQILEALQLLQDSGLFFGHLHASNVLVDDGVCRLTDVENGVLGVPSALRPSFTPLRKINTTDSVDVFSFGLLLYEMTYGRPPDCVPVEQFPEVPFTTVVCVLRSILSPEACKTAMPSVASLLQTPLFRDEQQPSEKITLKVPSRLKEVLRRSRESLERRLQEEQRQLHQHRRLTRAQSHHGSEEERKRRKILARKKVRQSTCENEEESVKNNNSGSGASSPPTCPSSPTPPSTTEHAPF